MYGTGRSGDCSAASCLKTTVPARQHGIMQSCFILDLLRRMGVDEQAATARRV
jgi:hypothetical protein